MNKELQWSSESYRLDKVKEIFGLPCVVRLEEGYMPPDESEEFAQGDIITLDVEVPSDKVGAYFIKWNVQEVETKSTRSPDYGIIASDNQEIFLPHSYDGKLKVMKAITKVNGIKELAKIFPGKAELEGDMKIKTNKGESVKLTKGTTIELDRVIPGSTYGAQNEPDKLVIQFEHSNETKVAALPFNMKGKFHTREDKKKYTIKEAIDRYGLPLDVTFINDEIKQKFYQEVLAGRRKLASVTETLRLKRIVKQRVLVGHYKPVIEPDNAESAEGNGPSESENPDAENVDNENANAADSGDVRRRTVVMIPVDNPEIGEIPVNICEGDILTIYESLVNIKSVTEAKDMVRETLCLDFDVKPGLKLLTKEDNSRKYENVQHGQRKSGGKPPPLPARPANPKPLTNTFEDKNLDASEVQYKTLPSRKQPDPRDDNDDYLVPVSQKNLLGDYVDMNEMNRNKTPGDPPVPPRKPIQVPTRVVGSGQKPTEKDKKHFWSKKAFKSNKKENSGQNTKVAEIKPRPRISEPLLQTIEEDDNLDGKKELKKMKELDNFSRQTGLVGTSTYSSDDLGEYEEINGVKPFTSLAEMSADSRSKEQNLSGYDEIEDVIALHIQGTSGSEQTYTLDPEQTTEPAHSVSGPKRLPETEVTQSDTSNLEERQISSVTESGGSVADVSPTRTNEQRKTNKLFNDLTNEELVERLQLCNLPDMADICKTENLDGEFFADVTPEFLKETMCLQGIKLAKFLKMRDENWVPK
ncbi:uncharacterized protein LOC123524663 [Mercenaria mercenaria]|uniref:uncharacterized protein LOC123524663 n=1 Tax=Mercenaria mercenaria TaxID=6596 RepID=UPI00234F1A93|nr:uncharacterized protein LOC123524663 [Mercenaria mercenaria]